RSNSAFAERVISPGLSQQRTGSQRLNGGRTVFSVIEDLVRASDWPFRFGPLEQLDRSSRFDISFLQDSQVPARQSRLLNLSRKIGDLPAPRHLPAWRSGLRDLADRISELEHVSDTGIDFQSAPGSKVFAERARYRYVAAQPALPEAGVLWRVAAYRLVGTTVSFLVRLGIAGQIGSTQPNRTGNGILEERSSPGLVVTGRITAKAARQSYLDRE